MRSSTAAICCSAEYVNSGANHAEGGWPDGVNINDPEATQRYRRKIEKDDAYIHCVMTMSPVSIVYLYHTMSYPYEFRIQVNIV